MFKLKNIKPILVPQCEELTAERMYPKRENYVPNIVDSFPEYDNYIHPNKYFWDVIFTIYRELTKKFLDHSIKLRNKDKVTQDNKIEKIWRNIELNLSKYYYSKQKWGALSMLV